jgi:hypothetical protein
VLAHLLLLVSEIRKSMPFLWASKMVSREPITSSSPGWEGTRKGRRRNGKRRGRGEEERKGSGREEGKWMR